MTLSSLQQKLNFAILRKSDNDFNDFVYANKYFVVILHCNYISMNFLFIFVEFVMLLLCNFIWECKVLLRSTWMKNPYSYLYIATSYLVLFNWNPDSKIYVLRNWQRNHISIVVELSSFELHWVLWKSNTKVCFQKMLL